MVMYPIESFTQSSESHEYNRSRGAARYVPDDARWYRLEVEPPIPDGKTLILNLGDSTTWGWPSPGDVRPYPVALQAFLPDSVRSVNLGVPGYSSLQGERYLRQLLRRYGTRIRAVTFYFGNNDATENGSPDSVRIGPAGISFMGRPLPGLLEELALYRAMRYVIVMFLRGDNRSPRVDAGAYGDNLRRMVKMCREIGVDVVMIEPMVPLSWPPGHLTRSMSLSDRVSSSWSKAELARSETLYAEGVGRVGRQDSSYQWFLSEAVEHDWILPRIKRPWRDQLGLVAQNGVTVIRAADVFIEAEFPYTFIDYCHPSTAVHQAIARRIAADLGLLGGEE